MKNLAAFFFVGSAVVALVAKACAVPVYRIADSPLSLLVIFFTVGRFFVDNLYPLWWLVVFFKIIMAHLHPRPIYKKY